MAGASIRAVFEQAHALDAALRPAFLDQHCDPAARAMVEKLLLAADALDDAPVLERDPAEWSQSIGESGRLGADAIGSTVGPFVITALLGEGGSARVFRATRTVEGVVQAVALKVLRQNLANEHVRLQFDRERQALVRLVHPNIAQFIDGGVSAEGEAWIALEYVDGVQLLAHAQSAQLPLRQRVQLMIEVAHAVSAAHRCLIVHRDLKPGNVMVTRAGEVKLLDFGIAKLLASDLAGPSYTQTQFRAFTPGYAAPEQRSGGAITTATDVYALGVLLGELLTGERPQPADGVTPALPTTTITQTDATTGLMRRWLRGDLSNILRKATAVQPEERYETAAAFAADLSRLLAGEPVQAHPPSGWYRMRKFVTRHRGSVSVVGLLLVGIVGSLLLALWQARVASVQAELARAEASRANAQTERAREEARRAEATADFLSIVFSENRGKDRPVTTSELLTRAEEMLSRQYAGEPRFLADMYLHLAAERGGRVEPIEERRLLELARAAAQAAGLAELESRVDCTQAFSDAGVKELDQAERRLAAAQARLEGLGDPGWETAIECLRARANIAAGRGDSAGAIQALEAARARMEDTGQTHVRSYTAVLSFLAVQHRSRGELALALELTRLGGRIHEQHGRGGTRSRLTAWNNEATLLCDLGEVRECEALRKMLEERFAQLEPEAMRTGTFALNDAMVTARKGPAFAARAVELFDLALGAARANGNLETEARAHAGAINVLIESAAPRAQIDARASVLDAFMQASGDKISRPARFAAIDTRARIRVLDGDGGGALALMEPLIAEAERDGDIRTLRLTTGAAARLARGSGDPARAVAAAEAFLAVVERIARGPDTSADVGDALLMLVEARRSAGAPVAELVPLLERAIRCLDHGLGPDHPRSRAARTLLAELSGG